jgi:hypothetical protein
MVAQSRQHSGTLLPSDSWFPLKTWMTLVPSLFIRQTLHQHTSFSLPSWNPYWNNDDLNLFRRLKENSLTDLHSTTKEAFQEWFQNWKKCFIVEESIAKGKKPNSHKVGEKMIYINCSESLQTDLTHRNQINFWTNHHSTWQSVQLATCITATTMMLSWNYSTWNTSAISCCVGTGPPDPAGVATGLVASVSLLTEKQHHLEQLLDTIAESKKSKQYSGI